jgi:deoxyhypusine synthase
MTSNEQRFNNYVTDAIAIYNRASEAKSSKNIIRLANKTLKTVEQAIKLAPIIKAKEKIGYLNEFVTLSHALIAEAHYNNKDLKSAIESFSFAQRTNKNTLGNQETYIRECYILSKLMDIGKLQENWKIADNFAQKIFFSSKKLEDSMKALKYFIRIKDVFIESKNLDFINKSYSEMLKICKKKEIVKENPKFIVDIFDDYAKYLYIVLKKGKSAVKYYKKAESILEDLNLKPEAQIIREKIEEINKN